MNNISIEILHEDNHLIAVNKKAGEIVQGDKTGDEPLSEKVKKLLKIKYKKPRWFKLSIRYQYKFTLQ